jgi:SAM-dependent methyltransferase
MTDLHNVRRTMRAFWEEKARENPLYYVSSYKPYGEEDPEEFWKWGGVLAKRFLDASGIAFAGTESVLEIGCGVGRMTRYLAAHFAKVTGIDVSTGMIEQARGNLADLANVNLGVVSGTDLADFGEASFDFVFSYIVFQHIPDPEITLNYIRESGRVLRPNGHFLFQVNNLPTQPAWLRLAKRVRTFLTGLIGARDAARARGLDHPAWVGSRLSLEQIRSACEQGGLTILSTQGEGTQYLWVCARKTA